MAPTGIQFVTTTSEATPFGRSEMLDARERLRRAAVLLDKWGMDCVVAAGGPVSTLHDMEVEDEFIDDVRGTISVPFTTSTGALVEALRAIGTESVIVVTPFPDDRDEETRRYLSGYGFDIVAIGGPRLSKPREDRNVPRSTACRYVRRLVDRVDEPFDTVYVGCAPFGRVEHVGRLEAEFDHPVITSAQAQLR